MNAILTDYINNKFKFKIKFLYKFCIIIIFFLYNFYKFNNIKLLLKAKKNNIKVCICTLGKQENRYIREFIEYYKKLGIDQIFLYDNNEEDGEKFEDVIEDYINIGYVILLDWRGKKKVLYNIMNHCYINNYRKFDWLIFYEIDEYINLKNYNNIKDFLTEEKFNNCEAIYLNWVFHTDNNLINYDNRSLHERFPILEPNALKNNTIYYNPVKSILKGHIKNIKINCVHRLNLNIKACNGFGIKPKLDKYYMPADFTYYYIDHYYFKSIEEFSEKINKGCAIFDNDIDIKMHKINRYFMMNQINLKKINYLEKKIGINLLKYKKICKNL